MKTFDVVEDIGPRLNTRPILPPIDAFAFEHAEETLRSRIVRAAPHRTHAAEKLMPFQESLVFIAGELGEFNWSSQHRENGELR